MSVHEITPSVCMSLDAHLRSSWRDVEVPLTDRKITQYAKLGWYGKEVQRVFLGNRLTKPCERCGDMKTAFLRYGYLPHAGWFCESCRQFLKLEHEQAEEHEKRLRALTRAANRQVKAERKQREAARYNVEVFV